MNRMRNFFNMGNRGFLQQLFPFRRRANRRNGLMLSLLALAGAAIFGMTRNRNKNGLMNQVMKPVTNANQR